MGVPFLELNVGFFGFRIVVFGDFLQALIQGVENDGDHAGEGPKEVNYAGAHYFGTLQHGVEDVLERIRVRWWLDSVASQFRSSQRHELRLEQIQSTVLVIKNLKKLLFPFRLHEYVKATRIGYTKKMRENPIQAVNLISL